MDFIADLRRVYIELRELYVTHEPITPRYKRAERRLKQLVTSAGFLGSKLVRTENLEDTNGEEIEVSFYEAAFFVDTESENCGEYFVCEMAYDQTEILEAELFCYYDGEDGSPCITDFDSARKLAKKYDYEE